MLASVTIEPRSPLTRGWSIILASAALATKKVPVRLIAITRSHSARSSRWTGPPPATPAAWTTPSSRSGTAASTAAIAASSVTSAATNRKLGPRSGGAARSAPTTLPPSASRRSAVARPMPDAAPVTTNVRERARSALTIDGSSLESALSRGANLVAAQLESELVVNDAEPDLRYVHCHLLADERVLRAGIDVAERALESTALA